MLAQIIASKRKFTAAGNLGAVTVYDGAGKPLAQGLRDLDAAQRWCERYVRRLPALEPRAPREPPAPRDPVTGY